MTDGRITWLRGERRRGPRERIGVLELRADGGCRAVLAERVEVEGRCHIQLARQAWGPKDALDTRWWSLVIDRDHKAYTVRTGSCGDPLTTADVPAVVRALEELDLASADTMLHLADGPAVFARPRAEVCSNVRRSVNAPHATAQRRYTPPFRMPV